MSRAAWLPVVIGLLCSCASVDQKPLERETAAALAAREVTLATGERPDFMAMASSRLGLLGLVGGAVGGAMLHAVVADEGNRIIAENNIEDPARHIAQTLAAALERAHRWRFAPSILALESEEPAAIAQAQPTAPTPDELLANGA